MQATKGRPHNGGGVDDAGPINPNTMKMRWAHKPQALEASMKVT